MRKLLTYLPFHFLMVLIGGILMQYYTSIWKYNFQYILLFTGGICCVLLICKRWNFKKGFTCASMLAFFSLGIVVVFLNDVRNDQQYYGHHLTDGNNAFVLTIDKVLKPNTYNYRFIANIIQTNSVVTKGKILLNVRKDSSNFVAKYGDMIYLKGTPKEPNTPRNPYQFNYKQYLEKQGIYHQIITETNEIKHLEKTQSLGLGKLIKLREQIQTALEKYPFEKDELGIMNALLLGQRYEVSSRLIKDYAAAGAVHILAISGLHVGIVFLILSSFLKPLHRLKKGKLLTTLLIVLCLWSYAIISGMSASVLRAVTMFSFVAIGSMGNKQNEIYFSLVSAMFLLLLINPLLLFDVGFQLSFIAVFSIVWIQPKLSRLWKPKWKVIDKIWQLCTVSIAAQIGVFPLSLYYFHQFPSLFLLSNLVIVPCLGTILLGGIIVICLALANSLPVVFVHVYGYIISTMNDFIGWVAKQEAFLFTELAISWEQLLVIYLCLLVLIECLFTKKWKLFVGFLGVVLVLQLLFLKESVERNAKAEFIVFHKSRNMVFGIRKGKQLLILHDLDSTAIVKENSWKDYKIEEKVNVTVQKMEQHIFFSKTDTILRIDSLGIYQGLDVKHVTILLQHSPKIHLDRLLEELQPKCIVADGSNYKSYIDRWRRTCREQNIPFHYTGEQGAYMLSTVYD